MDYELKYLIAICLIVKIAALSPEFSINEETEKLEQVPTLGEAPFSPSSAVEKKTSISAGQYNRPMLFNLAPGREKFLHMNNKKDVAKTQRTTENQGFDTCEHKLKLLQSSLRWRDIQKTLHWLGRILSSNQTNIRLCRTGKNVKQRSNFHADFDLSRTKSRKGNFFKKKKITWTKNLRNKAEKSIQSRQSKKFKKGHKKKYWEIRSRKGRSKNKRKEFQHDQKYKKGDLVKFSPSFNTTILKPNSVLFDFEKKVFKRTKNRGENFLLKKCNDSNNLLNIVKDCEQVTEKGSREHEWESNNHTERWTSEMKLGKQNPRNKAKSSKPKPWPHFVYHRVSSNFFHPELTGQNHGKSAYIAISVVNGGKSDSTDNNI